MLISRTNLAAFTVAAILTGPVSLASAQNTGADADAGQTGTSDVEKPREKQRGVLAGPKVRDAQGPSEFGGKRRMRPGQDARPQMWLKMVNELDLSEAQQKNIKAITDEMQKAGVEWKKEFGSQMRTLNQQLQGYRERNETPPQELREKRRELRESAPDFAHYRDRIMKELTEEQKTALQDKIKQRQEEARKRRAEMSRDGAPGAADGQQQRKRRARQPQMTDDEAPMSKDAPASDGTRKKKSGDPM